MVELIGVRFKEIGKVYYFTGNKQRLNINDLVVVDTHQGLSCGRVATIKSVENIDKNFKKIIRKADKKDIEQLKKSQEKEVRAKKICDEKTKKHKLNMKLVEVEAAFDGSKLSFYFTSEKRIDFRVLVKELASVFKTRIEMRQVGVRDEAKALGGLGSCGKPLCCSTFLSEFQPVSIKMAKDQGLSLNPAKISGTCGRLMCCLKYEQNAYKDLIKKMPQIGSTVDTLNGTGVVLELSPISQKIKVQLSEQKDSIPVWFKVSEIKKA